MTGRGAGGAATSRGGRPGTATRRRIDPRIAERRAEVRRERMLRRRRRTLVAGAVLAVVAILYTVERSSLVALAEVQVSGTVRLDEGAVRGAAALPLGTSTLRLDLAAAERRVEELPLVRAATVRRVDPLTVEVVVEERVPAVVLRTRGRPTLVDGDGVVVAVGTEAGLPELVVDAPRPPVPGEALSTVAGAANAFGVHAALPGPLRARVVRYEARAADDATVVLTSGVRVRFGRAARVAEKARALEAILSLGEPVVEVDVRAPANPVVVPAG